jgi:hypothetical protein
LERLPEVKFLKKQTIEDIMKERKNRKTEFKNGTQELDYQNVSKWINREKNMKI